MGCQVHCRSAEEMDRAREVRAGDDGERKSALFNQHQRRCRLCQSAVGEAAVVAGVGADGIGAGVIAIGGEFEGGVF